MLQEFLENHHPDKINRPNYTIPLTHKEHQKVHHREPQISIFGNKYREYEAVTKLAMTMKCWIISFERDFDTTPDIGLKHILKIKQKVKFEVETLIQNEKVKIDRNGFGPLPLAGILTYANPARFPTLGKFLFYCGFTGASRKNKKLYASGKSGLHYDRRMPPIMHGIIVQMIRHKDPKYYQLYLKIKSDIALRFPNKTKTAIHHIAINRVSTFLLKEIYSIWRTKIE